MEQQRLDEVHAKSIFARQAMRRDILRDVRVPAEVVRELRRPRGGINVCLAAGRDGHAGKARRGPQDVVESYPLREAVTTLEDAIRTALRVLGGTHPTTGGLGGELLKARAALRARETPPGSS